MEALMAERQKGKPLRSFAEEAGVAYPPLFRNALRLRGEIDAECRMILLALLLPRPQGDD